MKIKELRQKSEGELRKMLAEYRENIRDLRFKIISKQHKDVRDLRSVRKLVARVLTVLKEKKILNAYTKKEQTPIIKSEAK